MKRKNIKRDIFLLQVSALINPTSKKGELKFDRHEGVEDQDIGIISQGHKVSHQGIPLSLIAATLILKPENYFIKISHEHINKSFFKFILK